MFEFGVGVAFDAGAVVGCEWTRDVRGAQMGVKEEQKDSIEGEESRFAGSFA